MAFSPLPSPFGTLKSAITSRLASSDLNASNLPFLDTTHDTGGQMATDDALNDRLAAGLGAGPAVHALRQAAEEARMQHTNDQLYQEADMPLTNSLADATSEAGYARKTLPFALNAEDQARSDAQADAQVKYGLPAQIQAQGAIGAAQANAQGRVGAAQAREGNLPLKGLYDALAALIAAKKGAPTPAEFASLQQMYGGSGGK